MYLYRISEQVRARKFTTAHPFSGFFPSFFPILQLLGRSKSGDKSVFRYDRADVDCDTPRGLTYHYLPEHTLSVRAIYSGIRTSILVSKPLPYLSSYFRTLYKENRYFCLLSSPCKTMPTLKFNNQPMQNPANNDGQVTQKDLEDALAKIRSAQTPGVATPHQTTQSAPPPPMIAQQQPNYTQSQSQQPYNVQTPIQSMPTPMQFNPWMQQNQSQSFQQRRGPYIKQSDTYRRENAIAEARSGCPQITLVRLNDIDEIDVKDPAMRFDVQIPCECVTLYDESIDAMDIRNCRFSNVGVSAIAMDKTMSMRLGKGEVRPVFIPGTDESLSLFERIFDFIPWEESVETVNEFILYIQDIKKEMKFDSFKMYQMKSDSSMRDSSALYKLALSQQQVKGNTKDLENERSARLSMEKENQDLKARLEENRKSMAVSNNAQGSLSFEDLSTLEK